MTREQALIKIRKLRALAASPNELEERYGKCSARVVLDIPAWDLQKMEKAANQVARAMREFGQGLDRARRSNKIS